jgi:signal transduction histidine kinase
MLEVVLDDNLPPHQRENLEIANSCARTLLVLLNDVLDLSKIEAGRMSLEEVEYDLHDLAADCVKAQLPKAREKGVALRLDIHPEVPRRVVSDPLRLRQVLSNLLSNAVKFTEHGWVELGLRVLPEASSGEVTGIVFSVRDTGIGIPSDKLNSIFEDFTQADGSTSRRYGGTGLGLAITRRLVMLFGGSLEVDSEEGKGSEFRVQLPRPDLAGRGQPGQSAGSLDYSAQSGLRGRHYVERTGGAGGARPAVVRSGVDGCPDAGTGRFGSYTTDPLRPALEEPADSCPHCPRHEQ